MDVYIDDAVILGVMIAQFCWFVDVTNKTSTLVFSLWQYIIRKQTKK